MKLSTFLAIILIVISDRPFKEKKINSLCDLIVNWGILESNHPLLLSKAINNDSLFCYFVNLILKDSTNFNGDDLLFELHKQSLFRNINDSLYTTYKLNKNYYQNSNYRHLAIKSSISNKNERIYFDLNKNQLIFPDPQYLTSSLPDSSQRILALSYLWNRFKFFYPYQYFYQSTREARRMLSNTIDEAIKANSLLAYHQCILKLCSSFNDGHSLASSFILDSYFGIRTAPIKVRFIDEKVVISDICQATDKHINNIQLGDQIIEVNGCQTAELFKVNKQFIPFSNESAHNRDLANLILRTNKLYIDFKIMREKREIIVTLPTIKIPDLMKEEHKQTTSLAINHLNDSIVVVKCKFVDTAALDTFRWIKKIKWIIFDMRSSTQWILPWVGKHLLEQKTIFAYYSYPMVTPPLKMSNLIPLYIGPSDTNEGYLSIKSIILVNENTQSQGEFQTMALQQTPGAITIGSQTAGADGNISTYLVPGNIKISMTTIRILYPDLSETQNCGIKIDYYSRPTVNDLIQNRDPELELALRIIQHGTSGLKKYNNRRSLPAKLHRSFTLLPLLLHPAGQFRIFAPRSQEHWSSSSVGRAYPS